MPDQTKKGKPAIMKHTSALLSAFLSKSRINLADLKGQRPWPFEWRFFAWAVRPTPRQKRRKGMDCLWAITSSRYLLAFAKASFRIAWAVSLVFWESIGQLEQEMMSSALNQNINISNCHLIATNTFDYHWKKKFILESLHLTKEFCATFKGKHTCTKNKIWNLYTDKSCTNHIIYINIC